MGAKWSTPRSSYGSSHDHGISSSQSTSRYSPYQANHMRPETINKLQMRYSKIGDDFQSLNQVTDALANAGLESSNLIVGIDFTKSNEWTGRLSFGRRSLHYIGHAPNPYEQAISIIGRTLSSFDEDNLIPCFGFGDASTQDRKVFSFYPDNRPCNGFEDALQRYREIVPHLQLAGPTSFAPMIETAVSIVDNSGGQYHVLLLIADGQVTSSPSRGQLSPQERDTINAIVKASEYPLSIIMVGVGDGPWDVMREFDDNIPSRAFDNFQFVNFTEIMSRNVPIGKKETNFALAALMEIPSQYKATIDLQLLGKQNGARQITCLPPPMANHVTSISSSKQLQSGSFEEGGRVQKIASAASSNNSVEDKQTCYSCGRDLKVCPVCRSQIATSIRLH